MDFEDRKNMVAVPMLRGATAIDEYLNFHSQQIMSEIRDDAETKDIPPKPVEPLLPGVKVEEEKVTPQRKNLAYFNFSSFFLKEKFYKKTFFQDRKPKNVAAMEHFMNDDIGLIRGNVGWNRDRFLMKFQRHLERGIL